MMPSDQKGDVLVKVLLGANVGLLVTLLCAGLAFWNTTSTRLALLEKSTGDTTASDALLASHGDQLSKLWSRTAQNAAGINDIRDGVNARHTAERPLPRHHLQAGEQ